MKKFILITCMILSVSCGNALVKDTAQSPISGPTSKSSEDIVDLGRSLVEKGRTFVHHAIKRMAFIMPAIFFKLGIAMTLLVLVTIVAVNNGFIGFLLLVVGMSSVLARLQEARQPAASPHFVLPTPHTHYSQFYDRSDSGATYTQSPQYNTAYTDAIYKTRYH